METSKSRKLVVIDSPSRAASIVRTIKQKLVIYVCSHPLNLAANSRMLATARSAPYRWPPAMRALVLCCAGRRHGRPPRAVRRRRVAGSPPAGLIPIAPGTDFHHPVIAKDQLIDQLMRTEI